MTQKKLFYLKKMPTISMFYGIIVRMYFLDTQKHKSPHLHVSYQDDEAIFEIPSGDVLEGEIPATKRKLVEAWIEIHRDELLADWQLASEGQAVFKIEPLK